MIERKLAANEMGLLHEVLHNGQWLTTRDYLAQRQAEEEQKRADRQREEKLAREREKQKRAYELAQEKRKDEMLQTLLQCQVGVDLVPRPGKPHRGAWLMLLAIVGLLLVPFSIAAWFTRSAALLAFVLPEPCLHQSFDKPSRRWLVRGEVNGPF